MLLVKKGWHHKCVTPMYCPRCNPHPTSMILSHNMDAIYLVEYKTPSILGNYYITNIKKLDHNSMRRMVSWKNRRKQLTFNWYHPRIEGVSGKTYQRIHWTRVNKGNNRGISCMYTYTITCVIIGSFLECKSAVDTQWCYNVSIEIVCDHTKDMVYGIGEKF